MTWLNNLRAQLYDKYQGTDISFDLEEAIQIGREVCSGTSKDHPDLADRLNRLSMALWQKYLRTETIAHLEEAIEIEREATRRNLNTKLEPFHDLARCFRSKYWETKMIIHWEEAIRIEREVVDRTPKDHLAQAGRLLELGVSLADRYCEIRVMADLEEAILCYQSALRQSGAPAQYRIDACRKFLQFHADKSIGNKVARTWASLFLLFSH